jgi:hypothetical protein
LNRKTAKSVDVSENLKKAIVVIPDDNGCWAKVTLKFTVAI